jgi:hypothetical protein
MLGWKECIKPLIGRLYPWDTEGEKEHYLDDRKLLWDELNEYVHPSVGLLSMMCELDRPILLGDHFHEGAAKRSIVNAQFVFDLVWLAVLGAFPHAVPIVKATALNVPYSLVQGLLAK